MWTFSFNHKVRRMLLKTSRQPNLGHLYPIETIRLLTVFAIEVRVQVVVVVVMMTVAELIAGAVASALYGVNKVVFAKERKGAEDIRFIDRIDLFFKFGHRLGLNRTIKSLEHHNAV